MLDELLVNTTEVSEQSINFVVIDLSESNSNAVVMFKNSCIRLKAEFLSFSPLETAAEADEQSRCTVEPTARSHSVSKEGARQT